MFCKVLQYLRTVSVLIIMALIMCGCGRSMQRYHKSGLSMGTDTSITIFSNRPRSIVQIALDDAFDMSLAIEDKVSCHKPDSIISLLNETGGGDVTDDWVLGLIRRSTEYSAITGGAFDPSMYHILRLWDFTGTPHCPVPNEIEQALQRCGYDRIVISGSKVDLNGTRLDLGGVAKGAIVQRIADYLHSMGYSSFLVNGGGDIYVSGLYNGERPWRIAVANPFEPSSYIDTMSLSDCAVVTSGDYQKFFEEDGIIYHHIIDPSDGYPARNGTHSVTVIADDAGFADAMATAVFVMGADSGASFCRQHGIRAIIVSGDGPKGTVSRINFEQRTF